MYAKDTSNGTPHRSHHAHPHAHVGTVPAAEQVPAPDSPTIAVPVPTDPPVVTADVPPPAGPGTGDGPAVGEVPPASIYAG